MRFRCESPGKLKRFLTWNPAQTCNSAAFRSWVLRKLRAKTTLRASLRLRKVRPQNILPPFLWSARVPPSFRNSKPPPKRLLHKIQSSFQPRIQMHSSRTPIHSSRAQRRRAALRGRPEPIIPSNFSFPAPAQNGCTLRVCRLRTLRRSKHRLRERIVKLFQAITWMRKRHSPIRMTI